jgi:hypothetical protein
MENLPEEAQREQEADPSLRLSVWGGTQGLVFWCDGRRTVYDVALAIGHSTGRYDVELTMKRLRFLERYGYIEMRRLAAPKA